MSRDGKTPSHLILKNGLAQWSMVKHHLKNYKMVLIEQDLAQLHPGLVHRLRMVDYGRMLR